MDAPPLEFIDFEYPDGRPELINPRRLDSRARVNVVSLADGQEPVPGTGVLHFDDGNGLVADPAHRGRSDNEYEIPFPATARARTTVSYYLTAEADNGFVQHSPPGAPDRPVHRRSRPPVVDLTFDDNFEADQGWGVASDQNVTNGAWERGVPAGGDSAVPDEDADGSGQCFVTGLAQGEDVDGGGFTTLTSPVMDASHPDSVLVYRSVTWTTGPARTAWSSISSDDGGDRFNTLQCVPADR